VELEPELSACVETQAKRQYEQILDQLLKKGEEKGLGEKLELLRLFLESTDLTKLRNAYEKYLVQEKQVKFILYLEKGKTRYELIIT